MAPRYHLTEPFPSVPNRVHTGRGGAGNVTQTRSKAPSSSSPIPSNLSAYPPPRGMSVASGTTSTSRQSNQRQFTSGRGGMGNAHPMSERTIFSFDEELERARGAEQTIAPVYHIGRGGQGNLVVGDRSSWASDGDSARSGSISSAGGNSLSGSSIRAKLGKVKSNLSRK